MAWLQELPWKKIGNVLLVLSALAVVVGGVANLFAGSARGLETAQRLGSGLAVALAYLIYYAVALFVAYLLMRYAAFRGAQSALGLAGLAAGEEQRLRQAARWGAEQALREAGLLPAEKPE